MDRRVHRRSNRRAEPGRAGRADRTTACPIECTARPVRDRPRSPDSHPDTASARRPPAAATAADPHTTLRCSGAAHPPSRAEPVAHPTGPARADCVVAAHHSDVDSVAEPQHSSGCDPVAAAITDHPPDDPTTCDTHVDTHRDPNRNTDVHPDGDSDDLPGGHRIPDAGTTFQSDVVADAISDAFPVPNTQPVTAEPT